MLNKAKPHLPSKVRRRKDFNDIVVVCSSIGSIAAGVSHPSEAAPVVVASLESRTDNGRVKNVCAKHFHFSHSLPAAAASQ